MRVLRRRAASSKETSVEDRNEKEAARRQKRKESKTGGRPRLASGLALVEFVLAAPKMIS